ncbi:MAG: sigma-E processing peptidase SpoIIGA [Ruminococcus sp.]
MYYEIFIDVFFVTNMVMDYFLLRLVSRILGCSATHLSSLAGGAFGALALSLTIAFGLPQRRFLNTILVHVVINTIMVKFGCKIKDWHKLLQGLLLLYLTSFLIGGVLSVIMRYFSRPGLWGFLFLAATSYLIITAAVLVYTRLKGKGTNLYEVVLYAGANCRKVTGFCDTGNRLRDSLTGKPVSVVEGRELKALLENGDLTPFYPRYIPFRSLGCDAGVILTVTLDSLTIKNGRKSRTVRHPVVALAKEGAAFMEGCQMILNPDLVDG